MRVAIACDHAGFSIKSAVIDAVKSGGHEFIDFGTESESRVDYPDFAERAGLAIINNQAERGILICGSGIGMCITANKMKGIYAGICHDTYSAHQGVEHDHINVLCLGGQIIGPELAKELVITFLRAEAWESERHQKRIDKYKIIESRYFK